LTRQSPAASDGDLFKGPKRFFDAKEQKTIIKVFQGGCYVTSNRNEVVSTILGSCIAACIRDPRTGFGGMNHFLLPHSSAANQSDELNKADSEFMRYGSFAMEKLINNVLANGTTRDRLEVKVFGGGNVLSHGMNIGHKNADFVETFLANEGISIVSSSLRGELPRAVRYYPSTGKVLVRQIDSKYSKKVAEQEEKKKVRVRESSEEGSIELFD
jgi:chemotaxis protein CheD